MDLALGEPRDIRHRHIHRSRSPAARDRQRQSISDPNLLKDLREVRHTVDGLTVRGGDDISIRPPAPAAPSRRALAAGESGKVRRMITPSIPSRVAAASLTATIPMPGTGTRPSRISCPATRSIASARRDRLREPRKTERTRTTLTGPKAHRIDVEPQKSNTAVAMT
jgi:hypothetical protein